MTGSLNDYEKVNPRRDDDSLKEEDFDLEPNYAKRLKKYIIYLRRWGDAETFNDFKFFYESNEDFFLSILKERQLVSVADTYADWGDDLEKMLGLSITTWVNLEKMHLNTFTTFDVYPKRFVDKRLQINSNGLHTLNSVRLGYDDCIINFLARLSRSFNRHIYLSNIWTRLIKHSLDSQYGLLGLIFRNMSIDMGRDYEPFIQVILRGERIESEDLKKITQKSFEWKK